MYFSKDSILLDSLSIIPNSEIIRINNKIIPDSLYTINYSKSYLFLNNSLQNNNIEIIYRVFPYNFSEKYFKYTTNNKHNTLKNIYEPIYTPKITSDNTEQILTVNGNISKGMSIGNTQNMVMNSNLNLQLSGELSKGVFIEALLSDRNIPVQPNGYSQKIQEFDRVYIKIYDSIRSLQMGDVNINSSNSYFMKFNRQILGGNFTNKKINIKNAIANIQVSGAISKGKFNRAVFSGIESIQGPYPLHGANNETFIIILAGTEKVYLDGVKMQRGENADYIINYNTAEITFTTNHFITKDSRIIVEYEYSDKNYNRFLFYTQGNIKYKKTTLSIQYFNEYDAKNQPVNQPLTDEHKRILSNSGDNLQNAIIPNYDSVPFNKDMILYKMIDTVVNSITYDSVLVYSNNIDSAYYQVGFALVGNNTGNYIKKIGSANGKVFQWVAPINNTPQGNYSPVQLLIPPQKHSLTIAKASFNINKKTKTSIEVALSNKDINTFSEKDNTDNIGFAVKNYIEYTTPLLNQNVTFNLSYEIAQKTFNAIERYKNTEFNRDWNIIKPIYNNEHFIKSEIIFNKTKQYNTTIKGEYLDYSKDYRGFRTSVISNLYISKLSINANISLLKSTSPLIKTQFYRHYIKLSIPLWKVKIGINNDFENNTQNNTLTDSISLLSKKYNLTEAFISNINNSKKQFKLSFKNRIDFIPFNNKLSESTQTNDIALSTSLNTSKYQTLNGSIIWRQFNITNKLITPTSKNDENLLIHLNHQLKIKKRLLNFFTFYEIGTGMETRKEFSYIEVAIGQGSYVWIDYNGNGIQELNEFEIAQFPKEANYIKIFTPTNDYIKVYSLKFNETIKLKPSQVWRNKNGIKYFISLFNNTLSFRVSQKHKQPDLLSRIIPLPGYVEDSSQMNKNISYRNTLSFNSKNSIFGIDYIYNSRNSKMLLINGFDISENTQHQIKIHWNISKQITIFNNTSSMMSKYTSEFFTQKNYIIDALKNSCTLQWQPTIRLRFSVIYNIKDKKNKLGNETVLLHNIGPEIKINTPKYGMLYLKTSVILNNYTGKTNSTVAYNMLEGFMPGENYQWTLNFTRNINKFLRLSISYTGRKATESIVIHTGQFNLSAFF